jgi:hypothetical protein
VIDWQGVLATVVASATIVAALTWAAKALLSQWLARDIERFKATLVTENTRSLDELRTRLQMEAQRQHVVFGALHARRAEVIADPYAKLDDVDRSVHRLVLHERFRKMREDNG